jgi:hypothetical protein
LLRENKITSKRREKVISKQIQICASIIDVISFVPKQDPFQCAPKRLGRPQKKRRSAGEVTQDHLEEAKKKKV